MLNEKQIADFYEYFEVPEQFYAEALTMVREDEVVFISLLGKKVHTMAELEKLILANFLSYEPAVYMKDKYKRVIVDKVELEDGEIGYKITNFYSRYPHHAQFDPYYYRQLPRDRIDALNAWDLEVYDTRIGQDIENKKNGDYTAPYNKRDCMTLEEALQGIDDCDGIIHFVPCNCSSMQARLSPEKFTKCFFMGKEAEKINHNYDRGLGTVVNKEEAKAMIRKINKAGYMQILEHSGYCNCYLPDCYPQQLAIKHDSRLKYPRTFYHIEHHLDECIHCGICAKLCQYNAFYKDEDGKVKFDVDKCWECTMCVSNCPTKAIHAIKK